MKKNQLEMLAGILGGMGLIYCATKSHSIPRNSQMHFTIANNLLSHTSGNVDDAIVLAQAGYGKDFETCQMIKVAIFELGKQGSSYKMFDQRPLDGDVIDRPRVNNRNPDLGRRQDITPFERPNRQRYKIFWDCVTDTPIHNKQHHLLWHKMAVSMVSCCEILLSATTMMVMVKGNCTTAAGLGVQQELGLLS